MNRTVDILNNTWKPLLAFIIVASVFITYVLYPFVYPFVVLAGGEIKMPNLVFDNINAILLTGSVLASLRTVEKKINALEQQLVSNSKIEKFLLNFNKWWRPLLAYSIVLSAVIAYGLYPAIAIFGGDKLINLPDFYDHLNALLLTGGLLAGLKAIERKTGVDAVH